MNIITKIKFEVLIEHLINLSTNALKVKLHCQSFDMENFELGNKVLNDIIDFCSLRIIDLSAIKKDLIK